MWESEDHEDVCPFAVKSRPQIIVPVHNLSPFISLPHAFPHSVQALHRDIKATFARAPAAGDAYVSTEVRWAELERLFQSPKEPWTHMHKEGLGLRFDLICCLGRNIEGKGVEFGS